MNGNKVRREIKKAINVAWRSKAPEIRARQREIFPEGKPSPELFLQRLAGVVSDYEQFIGEDKNDAQGI